MKHFFTFTLRHNIGLVIVVSTFAVDQMAKLAVVGTIPVGDSWPSYGWFRLTHATNFGSALDLFSSHTTALMVVSVILIGVLVALYWHRPRTGLRHQVTFGLMFAGAVGNLIDRVVFGHVVDFIDVLPWFIFNVADVAILVGFVGFAWDIPDVSSRLLAEWQVHS